MSDGQFRATVLRTRYVTPHMIRVTLGGEELRGYPAPGAPDEHCKLLFPTAEGEERRSYTIRRYDPETPEVDIDFVAHPGGVAAEWALAARPGDTLALTGAGGKFAYPAADRWLTLVGDATALPAMGRIVEGLAPGARALVVGIVEGPAEEQVLETAGTVEYRWVHVPAREAGAALLAEVRALDPVARPGLLWVCGEAGAQREVRKYLRHELGLPAADYHTVGYWRLSREDWDRRYAAVKDVIEPRIDVADQNLTDDEEFFDALDEIYDDVGL